MQNYNLLVRKIRVSPLPCEAKGKTNTAEIARCTEFTGAQSDDPYHAPPVIIL